MSVALTQKSIQIRGADPQHGGIIAEGILQAAREIDDITGNLKPLIGPAGFSATQLSQLLIDTLEIRNLTTRFRFQDPPDAQIISVVGSVIYPLGEWLRLKNTAVGALTLTSAPTIPDGQNGQVIELLNISANNIVVQDQGTLAGSNLRLSANTITLGTRDSLILRYSSDIGDWVQIGNTNVL